MFNLEKSIEQWLKLFAKHRAFGHGAIHEMELHLRDHIDDLISEGYSEQEAFELAVKEFGEVPNMAEEEFRNIKRKPNLKSLIYTAMLKNFYFSTIRNLLKHKSYFFINISGLAIGIASFAFISLYILNELSYDRFHKNHENTYRVNSEATIMGKLNNDATVAAPMAKTMRENYPEVVNTTRLLRSGSLLMGRALNKVNENKVLFADADFFQVFDFELLKGNPRTALKNPKSIVLTETYAKKYFGDQDPMMKRITVEQDTTFYVVTGIMEDVPANSHVQFGVLVSLSTKSHGTTNKWIGTGLHTYAVLKNESDPVELGSKMKELFYNHIAPEIEYYTGMTVADWEEAGNSVDFKLLPIKEIHLNSTASGELEPTGNLSYIYIYGIIGIIILFIAIFNFVNLATAHSATRAKEVGVRKVIGSTKLNLIFQFILESVIVSLIASVLGFILILILMPSFIELIGKNLAFDITSSYIGWLMMFGLAIFVGILAGSYPSFVLSAFRPVQVLKGNFTLKGKTGWFRNLLVTIQFSASIIIIVGTLVVYGQIEYMLSKNLGFDKDQILILKRPDWLNKNLDVFKNEMRKNSNVRVVNNSKTIPGKIYDIRSYRKNNNNEVHLFKNNQVSYDYQELLGLEIVSGRFFSRELASDSNAVILNETAAAELEFDDPVGQHLISPWKNGPITIIGVVKNYNVESLHKDVAPVSLELSPNNVEGYLSIKLNNSHNIRETVSFIENTWLEHSNNKPFEYFFFDEDYHNLYRSEASTGKIFILFAALSIFIACLGLIGLITYTASIRKKEIGIRKVLGADTATLVRLLSSEIVRLIVVSTLIAWPLSYFASDYWLQNFANRINISPWFYISATLGITLMVGVAISFQTIKTALSNPIDSLRQE